MSPTTEPDVATLRHWYAADPDGVAGELGIDREVGLSAREAAARLQRDGPNELGVSFHPLEALVVVGELLRVAARARPWYTVGPRGRVHSRGG